jgi:hypothetical protein
VVKAKANDLDEHSRGSTEPGAKPSRFTSAALRAILDVLRGLAARAQATGDADLGTPDTTISSPPTEPTGECQPGGGTPAHP